MQGESPEEERVVQKSESKVGFGDVDGDIRESTIVGRDQIINIYPDTHQPLSDSQKTFRDSRQMPAYQLVKPHNFDLDDQINACLDVCYEHECGLLGFLVPYNSHLFLKNFCERLRYELGSRNVTPVNYVLSIDHVCTTITDALLDIKARIPKLREKDVLIPVRVEDEATATQFWQSLRQECCGEFDYRLILLIGAGPECVPAFQDIARLQPPVFSQGHILRWICRVVECANWAEPDVIIKDWKAMMFHECVVHDELKIDRVYRHLEFVSGMLIQEPIPSSEIFLCELKERCECYVQTSD